MQLVTRFYVKQYKILLYKANMWVNMKAYDNGMYNWLFGFQMKMKRLGRQRNGINSTPHDM